MNPLKMGMLLKFAALFLLTVSWTFAAGAFSYQSLPELPGSNIMDEDEQLLDTALVQIHDNDLDGALRNLKRVVERNPKFRLARLIYGDLLLARSGVIRPFGSRSSISDSGLDNLRKEARLRLQYRLSPPPRNTLPEPLLQLSESQQYAIVVDVSESRLYFYEQRAGEPVLIGDYYATTGIGGALKKKEGDGKTPLGVYFITSRLAPDNLPDLYGAGAFPINYPNEWDSRLGRTGYGIWIHGVPSNTYNRAPKETYGCIAIPNNNVDRLWKLLGKNTAPVILVRKINWISRAELQIRRSVVQGLLDTWRKDWTSTGPDHYARHYSKDFSASGKNYQAWMQEGPEQPFRNHLIPLRTSDVSFFSYPDEPNLVVVTFTQDYGPGSVGPSERKRQYWRFEADGQWRIVYEGPARFRKIHLQGIPPSARTGISRSFR